MAESMRITSVSNPVIKELKSLHEKKGRRNLGAFLLEGLRLVDDAVSSGAAIRYFVVSDSFVEKSLEVVNGKPGIRVITLPDDLFSRVSETQSPQGIMAVVDIPDYDVETILAGLNRIMVLENLQDPGNLGTIIRSADACGFDGVLLSKDSVDPHNPKVVRSTMGSLFRIPILIPEDLYASLKRLQERGIRVKAAHPREALPCWEADLTGNLALVIGNEGNGLSEELLKIADDRIMIPMEGGAESLNASSAASILLYESMRQKSRK